MPKRIFARSAVWMARCSPAMFLADECVATHSGGSSAVAFAVLDIILSGVAVGVRGVPLHVDLVEYDPRDLCGHIGELLQGSGDGVPPGPVPPHDEQNRIRSG